MKTNIFTGRHNNQHAVIVSQDGVRRVYFTFDTLHTVQAVEKTLRSDVARHGWKVVKFDELPAA